MRAAGRAGLLRPDRPRSLSRLDQARDGRAAFGQQPRLTGIAASARVATAPRVAATAGVATAASVAASPGITASANSALRLALRHGDVLLDVGDGPAPD